MAKKKTKRIKPKKKTLKPKPRPIVKIKNKAKPKPKRNVKRMIKRKPVRKAVKKKLARKAVKKKVIKKKPVRKKAIRKKSIRKAAKKALKTIKRKAVKNTLNKKQMARPVVDSAIHRTKIRIIGVGGGGSTIVSEIASRVKKADFYIANTDSQALAKPGSGIKRFQFGQSLTRGLGTGMNVELGEQTALQEEEKIKKLLDGQDLCIIIASLGGGTSSGAAPVFAKISRNLGNITYGIFTLPFEFEGEKKKEMALEALEKIKSNLNVYTVIPNERIFQIIDKNTPLREALSAINKRLADNLEGLIEMIYLPGLINIDFADLRTVLSGKGRLAYLNTIETEGHGKEEAINKLISSPLYPYNIKGSRGILYNITSGKNIQLSEVYQISNIISESASKKAKIIFGINQSPKYQDKTEITVLAAGCMAKGFLDSSKKEKSPRPRKKKRRKLNKINIFRKTEEPIQAGRNIPISSGVKTNKKKPVTSPKTSLGAPKKAKKKPVLKKTEEEKKSLPLKKKKEKKIVSKPLVKKPKILKQADSVKQILPPAVSEEIIREKAFDYYNTGEERKVRKNALQVRREAEEAEREIAEQEKVWDIPAILRRKKE